MEKEKHTHDGHRKRMRERYMASGPCGFADHELLEMMLFHSIPRGNTNEIAHALLDCFGSLERVICAEAKELCAVDGVGEATALMLSMMGETYRRMARERCELPKKYNQTEMVMRYLHHLFVGETSEKVYMLLLDNSLKILGCTCLNEGTVNAVRLDPRTVLEHAMKGNVSAVVLAHNHPGGTAIPSEDDIAATYRIKNLLEAVSVNLLEHFVFCEDRYLAILDQEPMVDLTRAYEPLPIKNDFHHSFLHKQEKEP